MAALLSDYDELWPITEQAAHQDDEGGKIFATHDHYGSVLNSVQSAVGTGRPPYNSGGRPPIWLAFNDGCETGETNEFADAYLWPYVNYYDNNACEDQSELGWSQRTFSGSEELVANVMWSNLQQGYDTDTVRLRMYRAYVNDRPNHGGPILDPGDDAARSFLHVYGDLYSRLHGVYTGAAGQVTAWYR